MKSIGITADCVCDLPEHDLRERRIALMYFYITTDTGRFQDGYDITSDNILEYLKEGGVKAGTYVPRLEEYKAFFERQLERCDELIHIAASSQVSASCRSAVEALERMGEQGKRVTIVDSQHLSTGMGLMVLRAAELRDKGCSSSEIVSALLEMRDKVSTTFITRSTSYLYRNGQVGKLVGSLSKVLLLHPVLALKNGRISLRTVRIGNDEHSVMRYVRSALKHRGSIDTRRLFITHAGCTVRTIAQIRAEVDRLCPFDEIIVTQTSATVSSNCGPGTIGLMYVRK